MIEDVVRQSGYYALGTRLRRIGERLQADAQQVLDGAGLQVAAHRYPLLHALDRLGPLEIGQLARALGVSQPGVTRSAGQLEAAGYVAIRPSAKDGRVRLVSLTEEGGRVVAVARAECLPRIDRAFAAILGTGGPEFLALLDRLEDALARAPLAGHAGDNRGEIHDD